MSNPRSSKRARAASRIRARLRRPRASRPSSALRRGGAVEGRRDPEEDPDRPTRPPALVSSVDAISADLRIGPRPFASPCVQSGRTPTACTELFRQKSARKFTRSVTSRSADRRWGNQTRGPIPPSTAPLPRITAAVISLKRRVCKKGKIWFHAFRRGPRGARTMGVQKSFTEGSVDLPSALGSPPW